MGNPFEMTTGFFVNPDSESARWVRAQDALRARDPNSRELQGTWRVNQIRERIAKIYAARWFADGGDYAGFVRSYVDAAKAAGKLPVLVPYNIVARDLGGPSGGGAATVEAYRRWTINWTNAVGDRPALILLEPDSIIHMGGLSAQGALLRQAALSDAVWRIREHCPNAFVYLDAGVRSDWHDPRALAQYLLRSGLTGARGVIVNVSNFLDTAGAITHVTNVLMACRKIAGDRFEWRGGVDTSRNGNGFPPRDYINAHPDTWWQNPPDRMLGYPPEVIPPGATLSSVVDFFAWVKEPGVSDGPEGYPAGVPSGVFDHRAAISLIAGRRI